MRQRGLIPISLILYAAAALAVVAAVWYVVGKIKESGRAEIRAEWAEANLKQRVEEAKKANDSASKLEVQREKAQVIYRTINREVDRVVLRDRYRTDCIDDDGLSLIAAAIRGEIPITTEPDKPLSGPTTAK